MNLHEGQSREEWREAILEAPAQLYKLVFQQERAVTVIEHIVKRRYQLEADHYRLEGAQEGWVVDTWCLPHRVDRHLWSKTDLRRVVKSGKNEEQQMWL